MQSLQAAIADCDGLMIDLFGVLHGGSELFDGALDAIKYLRAKNVAVVFASNTARRSRELGLFLDSLGLTRDLYDGALSSGELTYQALKTCQFGFPAPGMKGYCMADGQGRKMLKDLGIETTQDLREAGFLLACGVLPRDETSDNWMEDLRAAASRGLPLLVCNPDIRLGRSALPVAGQIGLWYEEVGGQVSYIGKPYRDMYDAAQQIFSAKGASRLGAVGDSIYADIAGAATLGWKTIFVGRDPNEDFSNTALGQKAIEKLKSAARPDCHVLRFALTPRQ